MFEREWQEQFIGRHLRAANAIPYGISFLDDGLIGLTPGELMLIGARTGRGKTALATMLATNMASLGKRVAFFALEADQWEIHGRILYRKTAELYYRHYASLAEKRPFPRYREWLLTGYSNDEHALEQAAIREMEFALHTLRVFYKQRNYTPERFLEEIEGIRDEVDVIIVDHLHYFDFGKSTEFDGLKKAAHAMRNIALEHDKPVILLAHLRKGDRSSQKTLPDADDFHGHSDIAKVATTILILSPAPEDRSPGGLFPTYFYVPKMRSAAELTMYAAVHSFDPTKNAYSERYYVEKAHWNRDPEPIERSEDIPAWAKRAIRPRASLAFTRKPPPIPSRKEE